MKPYLSVCPVCRREEVKATEIPSAVPRKLGVVELRMYRDDALLYECPGCGCFAVARVDAEDFLHNERERGKLNPLRLSALLREQTIRGLPPYWLHFEGEPYGPIKATNLAAIPVTELLARWPRTVPERIERTLCNVARLSPTGGHCVEFDYDDTSVAFAETPDEAAYYVKSLVHRGYLTDSGDGSRAKLVLTSDGWERFEKLTRGASAPENPVFVAMWFGGEDKKATMDELYQHGIQPAIEQAGYHATRVDLVEHNDWIMDQVLGEIRRAPFVVADFTGHRNGVYFEAGFARGLGIPVIHTCEKEDFHNAHFDTGQLNHVLWTNAEELRRKLSHRIVGTIGRGPHPLPSGHRADIRDFRMADDSRD